MGSIRFMRAGLRAVVACACVGFTGLAKAEITIGVSLTATGPAASLGLPQKNTVELLPKTIAGEPVRFFVFDDGNFPSVAAMDAKRFAQSHVDVIIGGSTVPSSIAIAAVAAENKIPQIALAPFPVKPDQAPWAFMLPQSVALMAAPLFEHMKLDGVTTLGFIGFADPYGEAWLRQATRLAEQDGIRLVAVERFARTDRSVLHQARKILQVNPSAVLVAASGTPGALPMQRLRSRGYRGRFYHDHGVASPEFLRAVGSAGEGMIMAVGPVLVAEQLPASNPSRAPALAYTKLYEAKYGKGSVNAFGAHAFDAWLLVEHAAAEALKRARPGTAAFRQALRDALETTHNLPITHGVVNMTPQNHNGLDERSRVLVSIENGRWVLLGSRQIAARADSSR